MVVCNYLLYCLLMSKFTIAISDNTMWKKSNDYTAALKNLQIIFKRAVSHYNIQRVVSVIILLFQAYPDMKYLMENLTSVMIMKRGKEYHC